MIHDYLSIVLKGGEASLEFSGPQLPSLSYLENRNHFWFLKTTHSGNTASVEKTPSMFLPA